MWLWPAIIGGGHLVLALGRQAVLLQLVHHLNDIMAGKGLVTCLDSTREQATCVARVVGNLEGLVGVPNILSAQVGRFCGGRGRRSRCHMSPQVHHTWHALLLLTLLTLSVDHMTLQSTY